MIWGIDLGTRSYAAVGIGAGAEAVLTETFTVPRSTSRYAELRAICFELAEFVQSPDVLFIEEPPKVRNMRTFGQLSLTAGAILSATSAQGYLIPVETWKKAIVGRGGVGKPVVADWLGVNHPYLYSRCGGDQNLVDAACLALYGDLIVNNSGRVLTAEPGRLDSAL